MYPTLSDLLKDLFGINFLMPIQTFGLFLMFSFIAAYLTMSMELKRKEKLGLLRGAYTNIWVDKKKGLDAYFFAGILGFLIGFKLLLLITEYTAFAHNPQAFILSTKGNLLGGVLGLIVGVGMTWYENRNKGAGKEIRVFIHPHDHMGTFTGYAAIGGLLGAKVFHNLENLQEFEVDPFGALISFSGLTFYGGLIVGSICVIYVARKKGFNLLHLIDSSAPGLILAYGVGRIGCQLSGDGDWGIENTAPKPSWMSSLPDWMWSFNYPHNVVNEGVLMPGCTGDHCSALAVPVFPTPFYETLMALLIFGVLWGLRKYIQKPGVLFGIYLVLNGAERFIIEKIRVNNKMNFLGMELTQAEIIAGLMMIGGIIFIALMWRRPMDAPLEDVEPAEPVNSTNTN
jgi:prolipoprotein diacylglyceryltransferase